MTLNQFAAYIAASAFLAFVLVWFFMFPYRRYRVSVLRHYLFAARDTLFAAAVRGDLSFDDRAYGMVRTVINGLLMKSDALSLASFILMRFAASRPDLQENRNRFESRLATARELLSSSGKAAVDAAMSEIHFCVLSHVMHISVIAGIPVQLFKFILWVGRILGFIQHRGDWTPEKAGIARHVEAPLKELDRQAYAVGESGYQRPPMPRAA